MTVAVVQVSHQSSRSVLFPAYLFFHNANYFFHFLWKAADPNLVATVDLVNIADKCC